MSGRHALTGGRSDHRSNFIPQTSIPDLPLQRYAGKHGNAAIDVVVDDHFALGMVLAMQTADVLASVPFHEMSPKLHSKSQKQRIEGGVVEAFAEGAPGRQYEALFAMWRFETGLSGAALARVHAAI